MRSKGHKGLVLIIMGLLLLAAALFLAGYNMWDDFRAAKESDYVLSQIKQNLSEKQQQVSSDINNLPAYILNPDMEMPILMVDEREYIGTISIPALNIELPVLNEWSYPNLKIAPCRYGGSVYKDDLILAAHNYAAHFKYIDHLQIGDQILFADVEGHVFLYEVVMTEVLQPTDVEDMKSGDWDLTLFTCTIGGTARITVRCEKISDEGRRGSDE